MNTLWESFANHIQNPHPVVLILDAALKSVVVLLLAGGLCVSRRRVSAATRHLIWFLAIVSLPFLPVLASLLPTWQKPLWSVSSDLVSDNQVSLTLEIIPSTTPATPDIHAGPVRADTASIGVHQNSRKQLLAACLSRSWLSLGLFVWAGGVVLGLGYFLFGQFQLRQLSATAHPLTGDGWTRLLNEARETLRLSRPVLLLQASDDVMPLTWGWLRPVMLLPAEAGQWTEERRRVVLLHELAHIKRWDCLTQLIARIVCALYWFNPLVWLAARRMCVERERACDDLVLNGGCRASDYAGHLVEIARSFRRVPQVAAIAMARPSGLENRITAIVDASRVRRLRPITVWAVLILAGLLVYCVGGWSADLSRAGTTNETALRQQQINQLKAFSVAKLKQSQALAAEAGETISPDYQRFFAAATNGDWQTVTNLFQSLREGHPLHERVEGIPQDEHLRTSYWQPVLEICLGYLSVALCDPKYNQIAIDDIINSIPSGSIYFGGTDPGRGLPTAFIKSHADADPFYVLTQNALADNTYLEYLQRMYGGKIYTPTTNDWQSCVQEYTEDFQKRAALGQLMPGEELPSGSNHMVISSQLSFTKIDGLLVKTIFDKNPDREFYIEESFPFDWMYPYLEPHGLIMKINRQPLPQMSEDTIRQDHDFWTNITAIAIGDWLNDDTSVAQIAAFTEKVQLKRDFSGFNGDPQFVQNYAQKMFSKFRSSIAGVYAWRAQHASDAAEKERMNNAADFAFRQAWALCPSSPEAVFRYVNLLVQRAKAAKIEGHTGQSMPYFDDAITVAQTCAELDPSNRQMQNLVDQLKRFAQQSEQQLKPKSP